MIIDSHCHTLAPPQVYAYQAGLIANRGYPDGGPPKISDDLLEEYLKNHRRRQDWGINIGIRCMRRWLNWMCRR